MAKDADPPGSFSPRNSTCMVQSSCRWYSEIIFTRIRRCVGNASSAARSSERIGQFWTHLDPATFRCVAVFEQPISTAALTPGRPPASLFQAPQISAWSHGYHGALFAEPGTHPSSRGAGFRPQFCVGRHVCHQQQLTGATARGRGAAHARGPCRHRACSTRLLPANSDSASVSTCLRRDHCTSTSMALDTLRQHAGAQRHAAAAADVAKQFVSRTDHVNRRCRAALRFLPHVCGLCPWCTAALCLCSAR